LQHLGKCDGQSEVSATGRPQKQQGMGHPPACSKLRKQRFGSLLADDVVEKHVYGAVCNGRQRPFQAYFQKYTTLIGDRQHYKVFKIKGLIKKGCMAGSYIQKSKAETGTMTCVGGQCTANQ